MGLKVPEIEIVDGFCGDHDALFHALKASIAWDGRMTARKTASFGKPYNYSQMQYPETPMHPLLLPLAEQLSGCL